MNSNGWKIIAMAVACIIMLSSKCTGPYVDGTYKGISRANYGEEYYGNTSITVQNGWISKINFFICDSTTHERFDAHYEHNFTGNDLYVQQCRNDWKGVNSYPDSLMKHQDIQKVDAMSGATWSCNLFKSSAKKALVNATKHNRTN